MFYRLFAGVKPIVQQQDVVAKKMTRNVINIASFVMVKAVKIPQKHSLLLKMTIVIMKKKKHIQEKEKKKG